MDGEDRIFFRVIKEKTATTLLEIKQMSINAKNRWIPRIHLQIIMVLCPNFRCTDFILQKNCYWLAVLAMLANVVTEIFLPLTLAVRTLRTTTACVFGTKWD